MQDTHNDRIGGGGYLPVNSNTDHLFLIKSYIQQSFRDVFDWLIPPYIKIFVPINKDI